MAKQHGMDGNVVWGDGYDTHVISWEGSFEQTAIDITDFDSGDYAENFGGRKRASGTFRCHLDSEVCATVGSDFACEATFACSPELMYRIDILCTVFRVITTAEGNVTNVVEFTWVGSGSWTCGTPGSVLASPSGGSPFATPSGS